MSLHRVMSVIHLHRKWIRNLIVITDTIINGLDGKISFDSIMLFKTLTLSWQRIKCVIYKVQPHADSERVIELYKSGAVASIETIGHAIVDTNHLKPNTNTIKKSKSFQKIPSDKESQSVYQNKRKLEQKIESLEEEISKGTFLT